MVAVVLTAAALAVTACGVSPRRTLDAHSVASQVSTELVQQYHLSASLISVRCPSGTPVVDGQAFVCAATLDGQSLSVDGQVTSANGRYTVKPAAAVIVVARAESVLESDIAAAVHATTTVACAHRTVLVVAAGGSFACTATIHGARRAVTVTVVDLQGNVRYSLAPPG